MVGGSGDCIAVFPRPLPEGAFEVLVSLGCSSVVVSSVDDVLALDQKSLKGIVIWLDDIALARSFCLSLQDLTTRVEPILAIGKTDAIADLFEFSGFFSDFLLFPFQLSEFRVRLLIAQGKSAVVPTADVVSYGPLKLDSSTYLASVDGRPLDLTYIEYELLKFLVSNPGQVFKREALLRQVWGFDYYGGARTVDVHIRRLRAKLGEEYSGLLQTVRSVGYKLGQSRRSKQ